MALFRGSGPIDPNEPKLYAYQAVTKQGLRISGSQARMTAFSEEDVIKELIEQGFTPIEVKEVSGSFANLGLDMKIGRQGTKLKPVELAAFTRGFSKLIEAGIPIARAVNALGADSDNPALTAICRDISGVSLMEWILLRLSPNILVPSMTPSLAISPPASKQDTK